MAAVSTALPLPAAADAARGNARRTALAMSALALAAWIAVTWLVGLAPGAALPGRHRLRRGPCRRVVRIHHRLAGLDPRARSDGLPRAVPRDRAGDGGVDSADRDAPGTQRSRGAGVGKRCHRCLRVRTGDADRRRLRLRHAVQGGAGQRVRADGAARLHLRQLLRRGAPGSLARPGGLAADRAAGPRGSSRRDCACNWRSSRRWEPGCGDGAAARRRAGADGPSTWARCCSRCSPCSTW